MGKLVWILPSRNRIATMVRIQMLLAESKQKNPDWKERAIEKHYKNRVR